MSNSTFRHNKYTTAIFDFFEKDDRHAFISAVAGAGKCLAPDTPVLTYSGDIVRADQIKEGDLLMGPDSKPRRVLSTTRGKDHMYRIDPIKGDSWICNSSHILTLASSRDYADREAHQLIDMPLLDYIDERESQKWKAASLKLVRAQVEFPEIDIDVDPYWLGLWVGQGNKNQPSITSDHSFVTTRCEELCGTPEKKTGYTVDYRIMGKKSSQRQRIRHKMKSINNVNVYDTVAKECSYPDGKRIPMRYLRNSVDVRMMLLAGILDSSGHFDKGIFHIITSSDGLRDDIVYLARSAGFAVKVNAHRASKTAFKPNKVYHKLTISGDYRSLPSKRYDFSDRVEQRRVNHMYSGFTVDYMGMGEYYGWTLSGDGRFLLGDFTITHNTTTFVELLNFFNANPDRFSEKLQSSRIIYVAFSKRIKEELEKRLPKGDHIRYGDMVHKHIVFAHESQKQGTLVEATHVAITNNIRNWVASSLRTGEVGKMLEELLDVMNKSVDEADYARAVELSNSISRRMASIEVRTFHSLGYSILREHLDLAGVKIDLKKNKYYDISRNVLSRMSVHKDDYKEAVSTMIGLADKIRLHLGDPKNRAFVQAIAIEYDLDLGRKKPTLMARIISAMPEALEIGERVAEREGNIDYTDMIYLPVHWGLKPKQPFDLLFVDEAQDMSILTRKLVFDLSRSEDGRAFFTGDHYQSIMAFSGAETDSVARTMDYADAQELHLNVCYRCPKSHLKMAQTLVPHIEPKPGAKQGTLVLAEEDDLPLMVKPGDLILCRFTAPLISHAIRLVKHGIPAQVKGRDIGKNIIKVIRAIEEAKLEAGLFHLSDLPKYVETWAASEVSYLIEKDASPDKIASVIDKRDAILASFHNFKPNSVSELIAEIEKLFDDGRSKVEFSTVHRAKGLEADRVFILKPETMPYTREGMSGSARQQERNVLYVALTRSKNFMCVLGEYDVWFDVMGNIKPNADKRQFFINQPIRDAGPGEVWEQSGLSDLMVKEKSPDIKVEKPKRFALPPLFGGGGKSPNSNKEEADDVVDAEFEEILDADVVDAEFEEILDAIENPPSLKTRKSFGKASELAVQLDKEINDNISITYPGGRTVTINLPTGAIIDDSDWHI